MAYSALFAIVVGLAMVIQWSFAFLSQQIPELYDEPIRIGFHIAAEMVTALALIVSGTGLLAGASWANVVYLISIGMLFYTSIVSPGYFAQKDNWK